jgi:hypothetical protein
LLAAATAADLMDATLPVLEVDVMDGVGWLVLGWLEWAFVLDATVDVVN